MKNHAADHLDRELLVAYANGTLAAGDRAPVNSHLASCANCRQAAAGWRAVRTAVRVANPAIQAPPATIFNEIWRRVDAAPAQVASHSRLRAPQRLLAAQIPLVRRGIWAASAIVMFVGVLVALVERSGQPGVVLALTAPLVAAIGVALVYGPENDSGLEVALATPTSPRIVLLARLTLVFGYNLMLALAGSAVLTLAGEASSLWMVVTQWLGPMVLLSALSLTLSLWIGPTPALTTALVCWTIRVAAGQRGEVLVKIPAADLVRFLWSTSAVSLALAVVLLATTLITFPRAERLT